MKLYLISDNIDTQMGLRLGGIEGVVVSSELEFKDAFESVLKDTEVGILLLTSIVYDYQREHLDDLKLKLSTPLIVEISDRHQSRDVATMIEDTLKKITGGMS